MAEPLLNGFQILTRFNQQGRAAVAQIVEPEREAGRIADRLERMAEHVRLLSAADALPLERLLVDRIVLCWLSLHDAELHFAQAKDLSIHQATYWQDRIDRSHRRYPTAIKTLVTIRKLALPVLHVNIAKRQTNIAGAAPVVQADKVGS